MSDSLKEVTHTSLPKIEGKWLRSDMTEEQAEAEYLGKQFKVRYGTDHEILVMVEKVAIHGGTVLTFCNLVKVLKRWNNPKMAQFKKDGECIYPGRLEKP